MIDSSQVITITLHVMMAMSPLCVVSVVVKDLLVVSIECIQYSCQTEITPMRKTWRCAGVVKEQRQAERGGQEPGSSGSGPGKGVQGAPGRGGGSRRLGRVHRADSAAAVMCRDCGRAAQGWSVLH